MYHTAYWQKTTPLVFAGLCGIVATALGSWGHAQEVCQQSARSVPVVAEVDVAVIGGNTGAVAAAISAAKEGAKVFLAAPQPYLGDDMTATLRLWLEPDEEPTTELAKQVYSDPHRAAPESDRPRYGFRYQTDRPADPKHKDTTPPSMLADGAFSNAPTESVQFNGDVTITADLETPQLVDRVTLISFWRASNEPGVGFEVAGIEVSVSDDGQQWTTIGSANVEPPQAAGGDIPVAVAVDVGQKKTRFVKVFVRKAPDVQRILLGELMILGSAKEPVQTYRPKYLPPRPLHVKRVLDQVLLDAKISYLYSCYPTDVIRDKSGRVCGVVIANRAGRQAILAKTVIDATDRATVARLAGAKFSPYPQGVHVFRRVVIGGEPIAGEGIEHRLIDPPFSGPYPNRAKTSSGIFKIIEYTLRLPMADDSWHSWAIADQTARSLTYHPEQQFTSDVLFEVPPDAMVAREQSTGPWNGVASLPVGAFAPSGIDGIWVLGGCAGISREQAEKLLRPVYLMEMGERLGREVARAIASIPRPTSPIVTPLPVPGSVVSGDVGEFLYGLRPVGEYPKISQPESLIPVLGKYDVVVIGGGTGGAAAGVGAARQGAKTLVVEYLTTLGGVGTAGAISSYYWGNRTGFTATVDEGRPSWVIEQKAEWWRSEILKAGGEIWVTCLGCGAYVENGRVKGAVVVTPFGRGVVLADVVVDSTGNADVAAAAGAETMYVDDTEPAMQGTGLPPRELGSSYTNTDFTITDETDVMDVWHVFVYSKLKYEKAFDQGRLVDTRERRRIVGEFTVTLLDEVLGRTYPDTICVAYSNFDTHGFTVDPYLELEHPDKKGFRVNIPYRCLIPKGLEGLLVTGLGVSAHRDAIPLIRMQADIQNQGYAAGVAAAWLAQKNLPVRQLDVRALQRHLVEMGNLPESVLEENDSFPLPDSVVAEAVSRLKNNYDGAAIVLSHPQIAIPHLREAYRQSQSDEERVIYAHVLAVLGDNTGLESLMAEVQKFTEWDRGWDYRAMGQFGRALSRLDELIVALGRTRDPRAVPVILEKLRLLKPDTEFSHFRAVALALEMIGDRNAARPLAELLTTPGMTGYVHRTVQDAIRFDQASPGGTNAVQTRRDSIRELSLARALYRCGDYGGIGEQILRAYTEDLRGHLARHAKAVLERGPAPRN
ncbi:MAG: FAD-dependent oxidoreductase [Thermogutta sp.]